MGENAGAGGPARPGVAAGDDSRLWGGTTLADRRAGRREKLLAAGLELLGSEEPGSVSVRAVCRSAQLTERYFYESFEDRDALVVGVYDEVAAETQQVLLEATQGLEDPEEVARAAVEAMVGHILDDPRLGRVLLLAPITEPRLARRGVRFIPAVIDVVREHLSRDASEQDRTMLATGLIGALMGLFHAFLAGTLEGVTREQFVEHCVRLLVTVERLETR
jgi:AcrR family transcriptional regulator